MPIPLNPLVAEMASQLDEDLREDFEERAGIMEFDAGLPRSSAEALALLDILRRYPSALTGVTVFQAELDGATQWFLSVDRNVARRQLVDIGGAEIGAVDLAAVLKEQFGGVAMLTIVGD